MPTVSYSEVDTYRQCRYKHQLAYKERWKHEETPAALARGTLFHAVMEAHYTGLREGLREGNGGLLAQEAVREVLHVAEANGSPHAELVRWMYEGYAAHYGEDARWRILEVEQALSVWLPTDRGTRSSVRFKGKVDLLVQLPDGTHWVVDHKTAKNLPRGRDIDLDDQMGLYVYLLRRMGVEVQGAIYNVIRSERLKTREMDPAERFARVLSFRSDKELEEMAREVRELALEAYRKRPGDAPRSPDPERCGWKCSFTEACLYGRKGGDAGSFLADIGFVQDFTRH